MSAGLLTSTHSAILVADPPNLRMTRWAPGAKCADRPSPPHAQTAAKRARIPDAFSVIIVIAFSVIKGSSFLSIFGNPYYLATGCYSLLVSFINATSPLAG